MDLDIFWNFYDEKALVFASIFSCIPGPIAGLFFSLEY